jgi:hypothetical protein
MSKELLLLFWNAMNEWMNDVTDTAMAKCYKNWQLGEVCRSFKLDSFELQKVSIFHNDDKSFLKNKLPKLT